jgi:DHA1 family multidrug resistance protein-like MFS transporter
MKLFKGPKLLLSVIGVSFLLILSSAVTNALRPLYFVEVGATPLQLGLIMALPSAVSLLIRIPASTLSGKLGRWRMMFFSLVLSVITTALFAFVHDPVWFFPLVCIAALTWAVFSPIAVEYVSSQSTSTTRGSMMGLYFTSIGAALFVGPLISSVLTLFLGLRQLFLVCTVFPILSLVMFLLMIKPSEIAGYGMRDVEIEESSIKNGGSFSRIFRVKNFSSLCVTRIAYSLSMGVFSTVYPVYAEASLGLTPSLISLLFTFRGVTNVFFRLPSGRLSDRIGRRKPYILAYSIVIVMYVLLAYVKSFHILLFVMALFGVGWGVRIAPSMALASESVEDEDRPLALSVFMTMFDLGSTLGSLLVGFTSTFLSPSMLLLICAPLMSGALMVFVLLSREVDKTKSCQGG